MWSNSFEQEITPPHEYDIIGDAGTIVVLGSGNNVEVGTLYMYLIDLIFIVDTLIV